jgi:hypothetical protein
MIAAVEKSLYNVDLRVECLMMMSVFQEGTASRDWMNGQEGEFADRELIWSMLDHLLAEAGVSYQNPRKDRQEFVLNISMDH